MDIREVKGCCPLDCQDTCSWVARVEDGRVTSVRGAKHHPITRGVLCAKVNDYEARTYASDRLLVPLQRTGPKGSGQFVAVSWDEALDLIAARFSAVVAEHGGEALLPHRYLGSMGVVQRRALMRIFHALGSSRFHGSICGASGNVIEAEGFPRGFDPEDLVHSRLILLWGCNVLTTSHHQWPFMQEARKRHGARIIAIDPIRTRTARVCDQHVAVLPGSDPVLAAALARVMLSEGLADLEFARRVAADFEDFVEQVEPWTPQRAAEVCGIAPETIVNLARELGQARPAVIRAGVSPQQTVHGEAFVRSLAALSILGGSWRYPGGGLFIETNPVIDEGRAERPELREGAQRSFDLARLGETLTDQTLAPPIKALMVWNVNPVVVQPDTHRVREGLARDDLFTVVIEHFLTDTARYADIVLPSTTQLEHFDVLGTWGHHYISVNNAAVSPLGEAKSHGEIMRLLAQRLGLKGPAFKDSDEEIAAVSLPASVGLEALKQAGWIKSPPPPPVFGTKLRISEPVPLPSAPPRAGMLRLLTPRSHYFLNSSFTNQPRQRRAQGDPTVELNEADARRLNLNDGDPVLLRNQQGALEVRLRVTDTVPPGVAALVGKWWGDPAHGGALANLLTASAWSPGGQPAYNDTFVEVEPANAQSSNAPPPVVREAAG